jgi:hypothetical protein
VPLLLRFVLAFLLGMAAPASGAGRHSAICRDIASILREGLGNVAGRAQHDSLLTTLVHNSRGRLSLSTWRYWYSDRGGLDPYLRSLGMPPSSAGAMSTESPITMTASLGGTSWQSSAWTAPCRACKCTCSIGRKTI